MKKFTLKIATIVFLALSINGVKAQSKNENLKNMITIEKISFPNKIGIIVVGNIHYPIGFDKKKTYAAIITVPPASGAKEQTAGLYAKKLAERGFVTLAVDASYQGESGGEPRYKEDPIARVEDIRGAVDYLTTLPYIGENRIGVLGVCAGGGYAVSAAMTERRIKAVATSVPVNGGKEMRAGGKEATIATLETVANQRTAEARGSEPMIVPWIPDEYKEATDIDLREAYQYYRTPRGHHPNWQNKMRFISMDAVMAFDAFYLIETLLTQPLQIIVGSQQGAFGSNRDGHELYQRAASTKKDLLVMEGASHFDLYDNPKYVDKAIEKFVDFYDTYLK
jgi:fermentation-respiration switch protein FrsA (DUF1100 family)